MLEKTNSRILIIDDEEVVRDSVRLILASRPADNQELDAFAADLFEDASPTPQPASRLLQFTVDEAATGKAGVELVRLAVAAGRPYAAVFVDMRMPGWDGVETVQNIRQIDRQAEIVFITAYSDHSIEEVVDRAGPNVGYHLKPFAPEEIKQIATKAVYDWNKLRRLERLIDQIGKLKINAIELDALLDHVFHQVVAWIGTDSALLAHRKTDGCFEQLFATGSLRQESVAAHYLDRLSQTAEHKEFERDFVCFHMERYDLVALLERSSHLDCEKLYLLDLFVLHAGQAIENLRLHNQAVRSEKLAAVGLAIGKVAHDLRSPVGAIQSAVELIRESPDDKDMLAAMLNLIDQSSREALALASDLLAFARNHTADRAPIKTQDLFQALRNRTEADYARHGIRLNFEADNVDTMMVDIKMLQRALLNLLQNSAEALQTAGQSNPSIHVRLSQQQDFIKAEVTDNGPGIPLAVQPTLFEPFVTHGKADGTGLGLAIVRQVAQAHGGTVSFDTGENGTHFEMLLAKLNTAAPPHQSPHSTDQSRP